MLNPFTAPACKGFVAEKFTHTPVNSIILRWYNKSTFDTARLGEIPFAFSNAKKKAKRLKDLKFRTVIGCFPVIS